MLLGGSGGGKGDIAVGGGPDTTKLPEIFKEINVPVFSYPETTARALGNMLKYKDIRDRFSENRVKEKQYVPVNSYDIKQVRQVSFTELMRILAESQLKTCEYETVSGAAEARRFQRKYKKIVLKIANEEIIHKSDHGLVKLDVTSTDAVNSAYREIIQKAKPLLPADVKPIVVVQEMITEGIELVLGVKRDDLFGPVIMFGIGGVLVELYKDVAFRVAPLDKNDIEDMILELQGKKILQGFRQFPAYNQEILIQTILNFSEMISIHSEIIEMDLNPIIWPANQEYPIVVDSRGTITDSKIN